MAKLGDEALISARFFASQSPGFAGARRSASSAELRDTRSISASRERAAPPARAKSR
jgi:hypothetical protein